MPGVEALCVAAGDFLLDVGVEQLEALVAADLVSGRPEQGGDHAWRRSGHVVAS